MRLFLATRGFQFVLINACLAIKIDKISRMARSFHHNADSASLPTQQAIFLALMLVCFDIVASVSYLVVFLLIINATSSPR